VDYWVVDVHAVDVDVLAHWEPEAVLRGLECESEPAHIVALVVLFDQLELDALLRVQCDQFSRLQGCLDAQGSIRGAGFLCKPQKTNILSFVIVMRKLIEFLGVQCDQFSRLQGCLDAQGSIRGAGFLCNTKGLFFKKSLTSSVENLLS
jgi:hypothetical protein